MRDTRQASVRFGPGASYKSEPVQRVRRWTVRFPQALCIAMMLFGGSNCGTTHAIINFTAPQRATIGTPFSVTVRVTINGQNDTVINSRIHLTSSDPAAVLPGDYYFTPADAGTHTWPGGFILRTAGNQTISGEIIDATGINGSTTISVSP